MKNAAKPVLKSVPKPAVRTLSERERKELDALQQRVVEIKCGIANDTLKMLQLEQERGQHIGDLHKAQAEYGNKLTKFASLHGIDVEAKPEDTGETWTFNGKEFLRNEFKKETPPVPPVPGK